MSYATDFVMLYKVVLTFKKKEAIVYDPSNESYNWAVPSCDTVYRAVQGGSTFRSVDQWNPSDKRLENIPDYRQNGEKITD